ncbi:hypothetical protein MCOR14_010313 [Pyricularia oryzae]|nr:hypothetical protein MCOR14_010313 [Pyricularia oryzae]
MATGSRPSDRSEFKIAIVCALTCEADAVDLLFDEQFEKPYGRAEGDTNTYSTGRIAGHAVVLLQLPGVGPQAAASGGASLRLSYPNIQLALLVGVCGGLPVIDGHDIYIGDVVLSKNIVRYDFGRQYPDKFVLRDGINDIYGRANEDIQGLLASFQRERGMKRLLSKAADNLTILQQKAKEEESTTNYFPPVDSTDKLFSSDYQHRHRGDECDICKEENFCQGAAGLSCDRLGCDDYYRATRLQTRSSRRPPRTFVGSIASGSAVMKSAKDRDRIAKEHGVIAFEMEGAGWWDKTPCIVVKGICDYADSHKSKLWQGFAAATAASVAAAILDSYQLPQIVAACSSRSTMQGPADGHTKEMPAENRGVFVSGGVNNGPIIGTLERDFYAGPIFHGPYYTGSNDVGTLESANSSFSQVASLLGMPPSAGEDPVDKALHFLSNIRAGCRWLLILDNADEIDMNYHRYIPSGSHGTIILTSRLRECQALSTVGYHELQDLDEANCVKLLLNAAGATSITSSRSDEDIQAAKVVIQLLGSHTLALVHAGAYIRKGLCTLSGYPAVYQAQRQRILSFSPSQLRSRYRSVHATFEASVQTLEQSGEAEAKVALELLAVLSTLHFRDVPLDVFQDAWSTALSARNFNSDNCGLWDNYMFWAIKTVDRIVGDTEYPYHERLFDDALRILKTAFRLLGGKDKALSADNFFLFHLMGRIQLTMPKPNEAVRYFQSALDLLSTAKTLPRVSEVRLCVMAAAAEAFEKEGQQKELDSLLKEVRQINVAELIKADAFQGRTLSYLGSISLKAGATKEAVGIFQTMVKYWMEYGLESHHYLGPPDYFGFWEGQARLADAYLRDRQFGKAIELFKEVGLAWKTNTPPSHPKRVSFEHSFAFAYIEIGKLKEAIELLRHVLEAQEKSYPREHPNVIRSKELLNLALEKGKCLPRFSML